MPKGKIRKVVIYTRHGSFQLPASAPKTLMGDSVYELAKGVQRDSAKLVKWVEAFVKTDPEFGLGVAHIPAEAKWRIAEYDGAEWVEEVHRTWGAEPIEPLPDPEMADVGEILLKLKPADRDLLAEHMRSMQK